MITMPELASEKNIRLRRSRVWYQRYMEIAKTLKEGNCENPVKVLKAIHDMINSSHGYGYSHLATSAYESLQQVVVDMGWEWK